MQKHFRIEEFDHPVNHHPVDDLEPEEPEQSKLGEMLVRIVCWQISTQSIEGIAARTMILAECLGLHEKSKNWNVIAGLTGVTRESVRQSARELEDGFNLRPHHARTDSTREQCSISRNKFLQNQSAK